MLMQNLGKQKVIWYFSKWPIKPFRQTTWSKFDALVPRLKLVLLLPAHVQVPLNWSSYHIRRKKYKRRMSNLTKNLKCDLKTASSVTYLVRWYSFNDTCCLPSSQVLSTVVLPMWQNLGTSCLPHAKIFFHREQKAKVFVSREFIQYDSTKITQ